MNTIYLLGLFDAPGFIYTTSESRSADIKGLFSDVSSTAKDVVQGTVGVAKDIVHEVLDDTGSIVSSVTGDIKDTVLGATKEVGGVVSSIGSNLTLPLVIAAGIAAVVVLSKK